MAILRSYLRNLPHIQKEDNAHFITFCTRKRERLLAQARDIVFGSCMHEHNSRAHIQAFVVMPDHVHLVLYAMREPQGCEFPICEILQAIKGASVHKINRVIGRKGSLWQEESFDHVIRNYENLNAKIAYVLNNPVRAGLVRNARDYRWVWTADPEFMERFLTES